MKRLLFPLVLLLHCASLQAYVFYIGLFLFQVDNQIKADIYSGFSEIDRSNLTIPEAIAFLKTAPHGRGGDRIGVFAEKECDVQKYSVLLKAILDGSPGMVLVDFDGSGPESEDLKSLHEAWRKLHAETKSNSDRR